MTHVAIIVLTIKMENWRVGSVGIWEVSLWAEGTGGGSEQWSARGQ